MHDTYPGFLSGGGEMGRRLREHDWSSTSLGRADAWPQSLRTAVRLMLNTGHPMYIFWGEEGAFLYNDAYRPSIGPERHPSSLGRPAREVWAEIWDVISPQIDQVMAGRGATWHENQLLRMTRNGVVDDVYWTYSYGPIDDESAPGGVGGVLVVCTETTAQVESARRLAQSERLRLALSVGRGIGTWDWDVRNDRVTADERFARLYGVDPDKANAGAPLAEFFAAMHPDDVPGLRDRIADAMATGALLSAEYRLLRPDGTEVWVLAEGRCEMDAAGKPVRFPGITFDITDRKKIEQQLRDLNADLERKGIERARERTRIWQVSPEILGVLNAEGYFETSNPAWQAVLGWSEDEIASTVFFEFIHPDDLVKTREAWAEAMERGLPALRFENRYRCKDESYRWLSWVAVPEGGKVYCSARDVTDEKQRGEALEAAENAMRQSQKMEAVGQLTGGVAHDFNNLLTIIRTSIDLLRRPNLPDDRRARFMESISNAVTRATKLTGQLLAFARRQSLQPVAFDAGLNIESVSDMIGTLAGSRIKLNLNKAERACVVYADASQFDTAIVNMAVNARDAMDGAGQLTIGIERRRSIPAVRAHAEIPGDFVAISISDTGSGIDPNQIEHIFEPFFTTKEIGLGTGLGLSQAFGFAKQSGGDIHVDSRVGVGTTFTLFLPEAAEKTVSPEAAAPLRSIDGQGVCILVVEDNPGVAESVQETLSVIGYTTVVASSASAALVELEKGSDRFAAVFSDVVMAGMDGIELAREVGRRYAELPVVLSSGYSSVLAKGDGHGFDLLPKPYSVDALSTMLRAAMARRQRTTPSRP